MVSEMLEALTDMLEAHWRYCGGVQRHLQSGGLRPKCRNTGAVGSSVTSRPRGA
jgi:hypothetical protein